ncbi:MAG: hypothetical protein R6W67_07665, partial [Bacteroidales bacterium]
MPSAERMRETNREEVVAGQPHLPGRADLANDLAGDILLTEGARVRPDKGIVAAAGQAQVKGACAAG